MIQRRGAILGYIEKKSFVLCWDDMTYQELRDKQGHCGTLRGKTESKERCSPILKQLVFKFYMETELTELEVA